MLVFAHPDDETVALGARIGRFGNAHFVHVTDGAPRNERDSREYGFASWREYRAARLEELSHMLCAAGIPSASHQCLDIPDQEASLELAPLSARVAELIARHQPEVIFTHPFEGGHPDHDACAFAVYHAVALRTLRGDPSRVIIEGAFYNAAAHVPGSFLPRAGEGLEVEHRLTPEQRAANRRASTAFAASGKRCAAFPLTANDSVLRRPTTSAHRRIRLRSCTTAFRGE